MSEVTVVSGLLAHTALVFMTLALKLDLTCSPITTFVLKPSVQLMRSVPLLSVEDKLDMVVDLKMDHNQELAQTLPARELHELVTSEEYSAIHADLDYCTPFYRISHLMPIHKRLSKSMFTITTIWSKAGRAVLEDLVELYRSEFEVEARLGLELKNCHCEAPKEYIVFFLFFPSKVIC
ncbi:hypothetical protein F5I97DRAFT_338076 [Phlebopus sp. FC_14]|nr:hypothetical protein F5I97DRAFT_338076 [Phlebopus sp. FC_14]